MKPDRKYDEACKNSGPSCDQDFSHNNEEIRMDRYSYHSESSEEWRILAKDVEDE